MKKTVILALCYAVLLCGKSFADTLSTPLSYLTAMTQAHKRKNYEQHYLLQSGEEVVSWRYRHAQIEGKEYAQLLGLDEAREEIILQHDHVGYFGDFQPFSLNTNVILDNLPNVLYTDFSNLEHYTFMDMGRARVANHVARVIRIVPNDEFRYQYTLWIDEESHLLLKSELQDRHKNVLEQFRVLHHTVDEALLEIVEPIKALMLPVALPTKSRVSEPAQMWQTKWIPRGFRQSLVSNQDFADNVTEADTIQSRLYSDGLFSFTVYVAENRGVVFDENFWQSGKTSVYSKTLGDKDIIIIGEIPLVSARHIVQEIELNPPLAEGQNR